MVGGTETRSICGEGTESYLANTTVNQGIHCKENPVDKASQICKFQSEVEPLLGYLKNQHERYLKEVTQLTVPIGKSYDLSRPDAVGCKICDIRTNALVGVPIAATLRMKDQIKFQPPHSGSKVGHFSYNRVFSSFFKLFPSCRKEAINSARRVINKLNSNDAWLAAEASFKLRKLFLQGNTKWLTPFDLQQPKLTYINLHAVLNLQHDSTSVRMTVVPNRAYKIEGGREITFNCCVPSVTATYPKPQKFAYFDQFSYGMIHSDLSSMFSSVLYGYQSSLQTITYCLMTPDSKPTYLLSEAKNDSLHALRSRSIEFGVKDSPSAASQALKMCVSTYRQYQPKSDEVTEYILDCVDQVCKNDIHMDDLCSALTLPRLLGYLGVTGGRLPLPPCVCGEECCGGRPSSTPHQGFEPGSNMSAPRPGFEPGAGETVQNVKQNGFICCPRSSISDDLWQEHDTFLKRISKEFLTKFAETLCHVMNFNNFRLKFIRSNQCDQQQLDYLVTKQIVYTPTDEEVGVTRPNRDQMKDAIRKMRPGPDLTFKSVEPGAPGQTHLSHLYSDQGVSLKIRHLVLSCSIDGRKRKSTELFSFQDYLKWKSDTRPILTKRSLFSALSQNYCFSGRFLSYFKTIMKTLIRDTLLSNPNMGWDSVLCPQTIVKLELAIQVYFRLVLLMVARPEKFNSYFAQFFAILTTDASKSIIAQTVTIISVTNLNGSLIVKSQHLELNSYAAHIAAVSIPFLELLSLLRGCQQLYATIQDLAAVGIQIPPHRRMMLTDSRIIMAQTRSPASHFVKRTCYAVAKIQLILNDMQMDPFFNLHFIDQTNKEVNFFADVLTRVNWAHSASQLLEQHRKLMDTSWLDRQHPNNLPGCSRTVGIPHLSDDEWTNVAGVLEKEIDIFKSIIQPKIRGSEERETLATCLVKSAATVVEKLKSDQKESDLEDKDISEGIDSSLVSDDEEDEDLSKDNLDERDDDLTKDNIDDHDNDLSEGTLDEDDGGLSVRDSDHDAVKSETFKLDTHEIVNQPKVKSSADDHNQKPVKSPNDTGESAEGETKVNPGVPTSNPTKKWKETLDNLIRSKHSKGLGERSIIAILGKIYLFASLCREHSSNESKEQPSREERQKMRQEKRRRDEIINRPNQREGNEQQPLQDEHFLCCSDLNLEKSTLGDFDFCWRPKTPCSEDDTTKFEAMAFQHLLSVFGCNKEVRGFKSISIPAPKMLPIQILRGRRQRDFLEGKGFSEVRLRKVEEGSSLENCLLWAAHRHSRGLGVLKAMQGLLSLNVHIVGAEKKLQKIQCSLCTTCARRKAAIGRDSDKLKVTRKGPNDYAKWAKRWNAGLNTVLADLHGPIFIQHYPGAAAVKAFIVCFLEMPLHNFVPVMAASLSASDLLLAIDTYASQRKTSCDLILSDFGSNMSRLQNNYSELEWDENEEREKNLAWVQFLTAQRGQTRMKYKGVYVRFAQGRHSCVGAIEIAQHQIQVALHSFNHHRKKEPLTYYQWQFVLQTASLIIASRPLLISNGKIFSPQSVLRLLGEAGGGLGQSKVEYSTKGSKMVTKELMKKTTEIKELRFEIAQAFLSYFVKDSFLEIVNRRQLTRRKGTKSTMCGDIFFCGRIFKNTGSVTGSLLRLEKKGLSQNHGLFKRVTTHQGERQVYIGRGLDNLFFICHGDESVSFDLDLPTYNIKNDLPILEDGIGGYDTFAEEGNNNEEGQDPKDESEKERKVEGETVPGQEENSQLLEKMTKGKMRSEMHETDPTEEKDNQPPVVTRAGRVIRRPTRFQSD